MNIANYFKQLSDEMYKKLLKENPNEPKVDSGQKELRALMFCLDFLLAYILNQGDEKLEHIVLNSRALSLKEEKKFKTLRKNMSRRLRRLKEDIQPIILGTYIKIADGEVKNIAHFENEVTKNLHDRIEESMRGSGRNMEYFDEVLKTVIDRLADEAYAPHINNQRKYEMRHNYGHAFGFLKRILKK